MLSNKYIFLNKFKSYLITKIRIRFELKKKKMILNLI